MKILSGGNQSCMELNYFFSGFYLSIVFVIVVPLLNSLIIKIANKKSPLMIDFKVILIEILLFTIIFGLTFWLAAEKIEGKLLQITCFIALVIIISSYHYLIAPIWHLISSKTKESVELSNILKAHNYSRYKVLVLKEKGMINAYAIGVLPFSSLILMGMDLNNNLNQKGKECILLHEVAHHVKKHLVKLYAVNILLSIVGYLLFYIRGSIFNYLESSVTVHLISVFATGCFASFLVLYVSGIFQKKYEYEADLFAAKKNGIEIYIETLRAVDKTSDGKVSKGGITHPTLEKRIQHLRENCYES